jgi:hypothetical protein
MAALRTLSPRNALTSLLPHLVYTLSRLKAHPLGAPHVAVFEGQRAAWTQVFLQEVAVIEAMTNAQARVDAAGAALDQLAARVAKATLTVTGDDRKHPLYVLFFAKKTLSSFRRPVLGAQLVAMTGWRIPLLQSPHAELAALAPELEAVLVEAEAAGRAQAEARAENRRFRDAGARRQFVDGLNACRKELHGTLSKLPHLHAGLPADFAEEFFLREGGRDRDDEGEGEGEAPRTPEALRARIGGLREGLAAAEAELAALEAAEAAAAARRAAEARAADEARLREVMRAMAEMDQQRAALEARLAGAAAG